MPTTSNVLSYSSMVHEKSLALTTIVSLSNSTPTISILPPLTTNDRVNDKNDFDQPLTGKRRSARVISMTDVSRRLITRKVLHNQLCVINNIMCFLALLGVLLMIIETEMTFVRINHKQTMLSLLIKSSISLTTVVLVIFVVYYNRLKLNSYAVNNSLDSSRVGLTRRKTLLILLEMVVCSIHPAPRHVPFHSNPIPNNSTERYPASPSHIDIDVALGLPMFARIYLLCRFVMFNSHLVQNASSQSLGYLNRVSINFIFLIKTYLEQWPTRCLLLFNISLFFIGSWSLRVCDLNSEGQHLSLLDSMWLLIVTFTTVGYGDLTTSTYCGRSIATIIALIGISSTALLISVLAQKLLFTRSEKYVHNYVLNIQLAKERNVQAANVIKYAIRVWYLKRKGRLISNEYIKAQRRLIRAIHLREQLKHEQKTLIDNCVGFPELMTLQREMNLQIKENSQRSILMKSKIDQMEEKLNKTMINLQETLSRLLNKMSD